MPLLIGSLPTRAREGGGSYVRTSDFGWPVARGSRGGGGLDMERKFLDNPCDYYGGWKDGSQSDVQSIVGMSDEYLP